MYHLHVIIFLILGLAIGCSSDSDKNTIDHKQLTDGIAMNQEYSQLYDIENARCTWEVVNTANSVNELSFCQQALHNSCEINCTFETHGIKRITVHAVHADGQEINQVKEVTVISDGGININEAPIARIQITQGSLNIVRSTIRNEDYGDTTGLTAGNLHFTLETSSDDNSDLLQYRLELTPDDGSATITRQGITTTSSSISALPAGLYKAALTVTDTEGVETVLNFNIQAACDVPDADTYLGAGRISTPLPTKTAERDNNYFRFNASEFINTTNLSGFYKANGVIGTASIEDDFDFLWDFNGDDKLDTMWGQHGSSIRYIDYRGEREVTLVVRDKFCKRQISIAKVITFDMEMEDGSVVANTSGFTIVPTTITSWLSSFQHLADGQNPSALFGGYYFVQAAIQNNINPIENISLFPQIGAPALDWGRYTSIEDGGSLQYVATQRIGAIQMSNTGRAAVNQSNLTVECGYERAEREVGDNRPAEVSIRIMGKFAFDLNNRVNPLDSGMDIRINGVTETGPIEAPTNIDESGAIISRISYTTYNDPDGTARKVYTATNGCTVVLAEIVAAYGPGACGDIVPLEAQLFRLINGSYACPSLTTDNGSTSIKLDRGEFFCMVNTRGPCVVGGGGGGGPAPVPE